MLISVPLVLEYEAVLTRNEHLAEANLSAEEVAELIDGICSIGIQVDMKKSWRPQSIDANDEMVLETALNGHAMAIVTFNRSDFEESCRRFGIEVLSPQDVIRRLEL
jgi:predicted nucleic acid-binding protein